MSFEDTLGSLDEGNVCIVCGKGLKPGDAFVKLHEGETKVPLCCPLCFETYQKDPNPYLERWAQQTFGQELRKVISPKEET